MLGGKNATGNGPLACSDVIDIFDSQDRSWKRAALSRARSAVAATAVGSFALFGGGQRCTGGGGSPALTDVDLVDSNTLQWSTASLSSARADSVAISIGIYAIFAGGQYSGPLDVVDVFNSQTLQWTAASPLIVGRWSMAAAIAVGGGTEHALFAGGVEESESAAVDLFEPSSGNWTVAALSQARASLASASVGRYALFAGGYHFVAPPAVLHATIDIFDAELHYWSTAALSEARAGLTGTAIGTVALFAGGYNDPSGAVSARIDILNFTTGRGRLSLALCDAIAHSLCMSVVLCCSLCFAAAVSASSTGPLSPLPSSSTGAPSPLLFPSSTAAGGGGSNSAGGTAAESSSSAVAGGVAEPLSAAAVLNAPLFLLLVLLVGCVFSLLIFQ